MAVATYTAITRADMSGFDKESIDLAMEAQDMGWTGRMSSKGHMLMRAPDEDTTMSISRKWGNGRSGHNMRATLDRWKRTHTRADFAGAQSEYRREAFIDGLKDALSAKTRPDLPTDVSDALVAVYGVVLEREEVIDFALALAEDERLTDFGWMSAFPDDFAAVRAWNVCWAVFDRRDGRVVDLGGPRTDPLGNTWDRPNVEAMVAQNLADERRKSEPSPQEHEVINPERPYKCEWCDRTFKAPHNLGRHQSTTHYEQWSGVVTPTEAWEVPVPKDEPLAFKGDPEEDSLDHLMTDFTPSEPAAEPSMMAAAEGITRVLDDLGTVALRMAFLEQERGEYEKRLAEMQTQHEAQISALTKERDNAVGSLTALKALINEIN